MKEWIVLQGWPLYLMLGMTGLGLLGSILSRIFYGRLAREAQLCGTSDYPMLHYIRQKYSSYYKLGMRPGNAEALVKRYLALHRVGPLALYSWNEAGNFMMGAVMLTGLIRGIYRFQTTMQTGPALMDIGIGLVLALGLRLTGKIFSVERLQVITLNAICDYLENYLKSKLDGEYGYGPQTETPDHSLYPVLLFFHRRGCLPFEGRQQQHPEQSRDCVRQLFDGCRLNVRKRSTVQWMRRLWKMC